MALFGIKKEIIYLYEIKRRVVDSSNAIYNAFFDVSSSTF